MGTHGRDLTSEDASQQNFMAMSVKDYDRLERAIADGKRMSFWRRGTEYLVIPERLRVADGREVILARHPSTGQRMELFIDELDAIETMQ